MTKRTTRAKAIAILATMLVWQGGQAAEKPTKDVAPKTAPKAAAPSATVNAAKAFDAVSKELYPKAKQEGNLIIYSVWDVEHLRGVTEAFMKRYPGIKTTYWQARNPEIVTRVLTEFQGGQSSVDVILSDNAPPVIRAAGGIMPY
ncbi:MAG TPA: hypothetical protein VLJ79_01985, partial [Candidatus Binatia bacterium]|nr:hypothetical protein [Candidatus Binatia bacterium]